MAGRRGMWYPGTTRAIGGRTSRPKARGNRAMISGGLIMEQTFGWKNAVVGLALTIVIVCSACAVAFS
jgi:hypothetical protein